jgi:hypothetical protein
MLPEKQDLNPKQATQHGQSALSTLCHTISLSLALALSLYVSLSFSLSFALSLSRARARSLSLSLTHSLPLSHSARGGDSIVRFCTDVCPNAPHISRHHEPSPSLLPARVSRS